MKVYTKCLLVLSLLIAFSQIKVQGQIAISNIDEIDKVRSGITYVAMNDPEAPEAEAYINVIRENWTLSELQFIKYEEIVDHLTPTSSFLTISGYETNTQFINLYASGSRRYGINYSNTHLYLELWTCRDKYFEKLEKKQIDFKDKDKIQVARIELFTDFQTLSDPDLIFQSDYSGEGHIRNWNPGVLRNYIRALVAYLDQGEYRTLYAGIQNENQINKLKRDTLFIPEYVLIKFNMFTGDESEQHEAQDIFGEYEYPYELITMEELSDRILREEEFYYLIYVKSSTDKYVSIINSVTGEFIYSRYSPASYNLKSKDFEYLMYIIQSN